MSTAALTEAVFYILLSLDAPLHGYGIMQNAERLSDTLQSFGIEAHIINVTRGPSVRNGP